MVIIRNGVMQSVEQGSDSSHAHGTLVAADVSVVRVRRLLLGAADAVAGGAMPHGAEYSDRTRLAAPDLMIEPGVQWQTLVPQHKEPLPEPSASTPASLPLQPCLRSRLPARLIMIR